MFRKILHLLLKKEPYVCSMQIGKAMNNIGSLYQELWDVLTAYNVLEKADEIYGATGKSESTENKFSYCINDYYQFIEAYTFRVVSI